ncbi:MAG: hypothetical protein WEB52_02890 [Dehalococcoidia bacterium]
MEFARQDLAASMPAYVDEFRRVLDEADGDVYRATEQTARLLGDGRPALRSLLTAIFDTDYVALQVRHAYQQLKTSVTSTDPARARQFNYHLDHWIFQMDAYLERCDTAFTKVVRTMVRPRLQEGWTKIEADVKSEIAAMKRVMAERRDPLAHGLGGGVSAVAGHWEPILAAPDLIPFDQVFLEATRTAEGEALDTARRQRLFGYIEQSSLIVFAKIEAVSRWLLARLDELDEAV